MRLGNSGPTGPSIVHLTPETHSKPCEWHNRVVPWQAGCHGVHPVDVWAAPHLGLGSPGRGTWLALPGPPWGYMHQGMDHINLWCPSPSFIPHPAPCMQLSHAHLHVPSLYLLRPAVSAWQPPVGRLTVPMPAGRGSSTKALPLCLHWHQWEGQGGLWHWEQGKQQPRSPL
jgi:hypothetical protein